MNIDDLVALALDEDIGSGDLTSESCVPVTLVGRATIRAKQALIVAGQDFAQRVFEAVAARYDTEVVYTPTIADGESAQVGDDIASIEGSKLAILVGERLALNGLMKLSESRHIPESMWRPPVRQALWWWILVRRPRCCEGLKSMPCVVVGE